ncbi:probable E3 SUMO-protein ligase RNF212 [Actinia tenebrosa]|uniref:Probable E3 SUMO-protein ligase RNF212 n=1 Tax=Actinia tenebrosa TaxID=6105 RepID=A0A6P8I062_ACTTE|nr:probable E3 SUMO-protein ligase RNF212 [Actinia tenebrosa]
MSGWVRCNSCCSKPENPETCKLCKNPCKSIMLTSQMKPEVEEYFMDIPTLLNRQQKKLLQVYEFQRSHWKTFVSLHDKQESSLEKLQKRLPNLMELEREILKLREENNYLKRLLSEGQTFSPGTNKVPSPGISLRRGGNSSSPYGRVVTTTPQQDASKRWQSQLPRTPAGPSRLTVRTPPSNGMIGSISRRTPSPLSQRPVSTGNTPGSIIRMACSPGQPEPITPTMYKAAGAQNFSPMAVNLPMSPSTTTKIGSWTSSQSQISSSHGHHTPGMSTSGGETVTTHSSQLDPARRQIQDTKKHERVSKAVRSPYLHVDGGFLLVIINIVLSNVLLF